MINPFSKDAAGEMNLKRNEYDLSRSSLFTTEWGRLDPIFSQEVIPGTTIKLDSSVAIQGMPTVFPLQTKVRCSMEFYYCRNRNVHKNFEDFIFHTKDIVSPYILPDTTAKKKEMFKTGSISDFFGFPTTIGSATDGVSVTFNSLGNVIPIGQRTSYSILPSKAAIMENINYLESKGISSSLSLATCFRFMLNSFDAGYYLTSASRISVNLYNAASGALSITTPFVYLYDLDKSSYLLAESCSFTMSNDLLSWVQSNSFSSIFIDYFNNHNCRICIGFSTFSTAADSTGYLDTGNRFMTSIISSDSVTSNWTSYSISNLGYNRILDATDDSVLANHPVVGNNPTMKVSAYPYRHYEMITNYYYRNDKNNPYYLNGEPQYNKFIPSDDDGADSNLYTFHYKPWEQDQFTSATQSPQFGEAPLVGITYNGVGETADLTFTAQVNGEEKEVHTMVGVDADGNIDSILDFDNEVPSANLRTLQKQINAGISINDFRVTNSFQRFLENTLRRGLRYRNQMKSHFGVSVDYPDIDIPQYIGGYSGVLQVGKVTNMADSPNAGLGDFVGQLSGQISSQHSISHYCPEHGYIMGIFSISPIPVYSQSCRKNLLKTDYLDYFQAEFGKIGMVPIHYSEVMPLQNTGTQSVDDVFGYQKAWYDYMRGLDESHCDFRTSLKDFVLQRTFANRPTLAGDFTTINPEHMNDVFVTQNIADAYGSTSKFLCNFAVRCIASQPIPMFGTPSLE